MLTYSLSAPKLLGTAKEYSLPLSTVEHYVDLLHIVTIILYDYPRRIKYVLACQSFEICTRKGK